MLSICAILVLLAFCYAATSLSLFVGVSRLKKNSARNVTSLPHAGSADFPFVSILVPARNEERSIADCLESLVRQQYPSDKYEVVAVNDRSADNTLAIIQDYQKKYKTVKCVNIDFNSSGLTGKQNAINEGLRRCIGEIILNTDADCIAGPLWVRRIVSQFTPQIGLTIGFSTTYSADGSGSFFTDLQSLDMLLLMDAAAGAIGMNVPVSCLGRNLAYRKAVLDDIDYLGMEYTITEDAALIQAVAKNPKWGIAVAYDKDASVSTLAEESVKQFFSQRTRWVLGGQATRSWSQIPLHVMFLFHLCLVISFFAMFFVRSLIAVILFSVLVKMTLDFIRCWRVCKEFKRTDLLRLFVPYEVFMISYSILIGFGSMFIRQVRWKGEACTKNIRDVHRA